MAESTMQVTLPGGRGGFYIESIDLERAIEEYLPASTVQLREVLAERTGTPVEEYAEYDFATCLLQLADFEFGARMNEAEAASTGVGS